MTTETLERRELSTETRFIYAVVGERGAIHFWCEAASDWSQKHFGHKWIGGVEVHWRNKPDWGRTEPDRTDCWILDGPCWHDGSSLYADEVFIPCWSSCKEMNDYEFLWRRLEHEYASRFNRED